MVSRKLTRRLEQLEDRVLPAENRVMLRIDFVNSDGTVAPGGFTVDPWGARTPKSPQTRGR